LFSQRAQHLILLLVCGICSTALAGPSFQGLGDLPGGDSESYASAISLDGTTVVGQGLSANGYEAFRWTAAGGIQGLGDLSGGTFYSAAYAVSANGAVVVGEGQSTDGQEAFRWTASSGAMTGLGDLPGDIFASYATAVNANGSVVAGGAWPANGATQAFRWTSAGGMTGLTPASGTFMEGTAYGMSSDGAVIVGDQGNPDSGSAFRWTAASGMVTLPTPRNSSGTLASYSSARAVSADGLLIAGQAVFRKTTYPPSETQEAILWNAGTFTRLGDLAGGTISAGANDVAAIGSVVVGFSSTDNGYEAFIWDPTNGMRRLQDVLETQYQLDVSGWTLVSAEGISGDGMTIVGWGIDPLGNTQAWIATLPEPAGIAALATLCGAAILRRRRA
jgi:probable HAF family extracellular repeat protein